MDIQSATAKLGKTVSELQAFERLPRQFRNTAKGETEVAGLVEREDDAVRQLASVPSASCSDLLAKISELGRWRAKWPDEFCYPEIVDGLIDSIVADAKRLENPHA